MSGLEQLARACDTLNEAVGRAVAWLTLAMVAVTFAIVLLRYLFDTGWIAVQESVTYMHALVFLLGASYTLKHDGHVRVDILYRRQSLRGQAWIDLAGTLLLLVPVSISILWLSWEYVSVSWSLREGSQETGGLPGVFLLKTAIPVMAILLLVQGLSQAIRSMLLLRGHTDAGPEHDGRGEL